MPFTVLSLFDGMSCGQLALNRAGVRYDQYFASEVDDWAIQITQRNYPNTVQLGDVRKIKASDLPKIDLLIGGSPCQGFSTSGKGLNFSDPRSILFFEFVRLLKECTPRYFMLENVAMRREWANIISGYLNVNYIKINSELVSAQHRPRFYWTNIPDVGVPENKKILLQDILESENDVSWVYTPIEGYVKERLNIPTTEKPLLLNINKTGVGMSGRVLSPLSRKSHSLTATGSNWIKYGYIQFNENGEPSILKWRQLTAREWERLQTVPEDYTAGLPDYRRCKMLGNGWTVEVIAHIFKQLHSGKSPIDFFPISLFPWQNFVVSS